MPASSAQLLAPQARALLFDPPVEREEALRRCALAPEDLALARRHRRSHNRLGFAVQLALVRDLGRPLRLDEVLLSAVVEAVADQLGVEPAIFELYARRDVTRREHASEIAALLELRPMRQADYRAAIRAAAACANGTDQGEAIARAVMADLKERRITMPPPALVERLALAGRAAARRQSHRDLIRDLSDEQRRALDALLTERAEDGRTLHGWIGEAREGPTLKNLAGVAARLEALRRIGLDEARRRTVHATAVVEQAMAGVPTFSDLLAIPNGSLLAMIMGPRAQDIVCTDPSEGEPSAAAQAETRPVGIIPRPIAFAAAVTPARAVFTNEAITLHGKAADLINALLPEFRAALVAGRLGSSLPFKKTDQLAREIGMSDAALRQMVQRARSELTLKFHEAFGAELQEDDIVQSRPWQGYRLNPQLALAPMLLVAGSTEAAAE